MCRKMCGTVEIGGWGRVLGGAALLRGLHGGNGLRACTAKRAFPACLRARHAMRHGSSRRDLLARRFTGRCGGGLQLK